MNKVIMISYIFVVKFTMVMLLLNSVFNFKISFLLYLTGTKRWQDYVEQGEDLDLDSPLRRTSRNLDGEDGWDGDAFPLGEGVLTRNLGLDVVVVVTKVRKFC